MNLLRYVLGACAAAGLAVGVAAAQPAPQPASSAAPAQPAPAQPTQPHAAQPDKATAAATSPPQGVSTVVTVDANGDHHLLTSSGPVPDTPQNRAKYGPPASNGGRDTPPAGN